MDTNIQEEGNYYGDILYLVRNGNHVEPEPKVKSFKKNSIDWIMMFIQDLYEQEAMIYSMNISIRV